uniref:Uncharacterized protein n=1 Tax=Arundo donax TaxID=35708 RepID=A0A0A9ARJ5_ARUDO
MPQQDNLQCP